MGKLDNVRIVAGGWAGSVWTIFCISEDGN